MTKELRKQIEEINKEFEEHKNQLMKERNEAEQSTIKWNEE